MKILPVKLPGKKASIPCYVDNWDYEILKNRKMFGEFARYE